METERLVPRRRRELGTKAHHRHCQRYEDQDLALRGESYGGPASSTRTLTLGFADNLFATTLPAVPPNITSSKYIVMNLRVDLTPNDDEIEYDISRNVGNPC